MAMTLQEHIQYWTQSAGEDWLAAHSLLRDKHLVQAMFFIHLNLEKLFKANWILDNGESFPPMTHNLENLYAQTELELSASEIDLLKMVTTWNMEGRYQDYRNKLSKAYTFEYIQEKLLQIEALRKCLLERLP
jgi:HEPN domain-containing protein